MTVNEMAARAHDMSKAHGFWHEQDAHDVTTILSKLMLVCSEVGEAAEAVRSVDIEPAETLYSDSGKPEGLPSELADIIIRVGDLACALDINLEAAISEKMEHNAQRVWRHDKRT